MRSSCSGVGPLGERGLEQPGFGLGAARLGLGSAAAAAARLPGLLGASASRLGLFGGGGGRLKKLVMLPCDAMFACALAPLAS